MNGRKKLIIFPILTGIIAIILYGIVFFQPIFIHSFYHMVMEVIAAQALLVLTLILILFCIFWNRLGYKKIKKFSIASFCLLLVGFIIVSLYGNFIWYECYTPKQYLENKEYMQFYTPFHDLQDEKKEQLGLRVYHTVKSDFVEVECYSDVDYNFEYFSCFSPYLIEKYRLERTIPTPLNEIYVDVVAAPQKKVIDGTKVTAFIDGNNYAIIIRDFNKIAYASLKNAPENITFVDFARTAIFQKQSLKTTVNDKIFLDIPIAEMVECFVKEFI